MTPKQALEDLLGQHTELRAIMNVCELLADQLDAEQIEPEELVREVVRLRIAFDAHTQFEELFLRPILRDANVFAAVRADQLLDDHVREHQQIQRRLAPGITAELRLTLDGLRSHLDTEERHFLSSKLR